MPNHENLVIHQAAHAASVHGVVGRVVANLLRQTNRILFGCDIGIGANIDDSVQFFHCGLGCVIHSDVVLGRGCKVFPHVVIGNSWGGGWGVPRIGDDVLLGAGCVLLGDIIIGDGAVIGANAVVTKSVPAGCTVVGCPARIIKWADSPRREDSE